MVFKYTRLLLCHFLVKSVEVCEECDRCTHADFVDGLYRIYKSVEICWELQLIFSLFLRWSDDFDHLETCNLWTFHKSNGRISLMMEIFHSCFHSLVYQAYKNCVCHHYLTGFSLLSHLLNIVVCSTYLVCKLPDGPQYYFYTLEYVR